MKNAAFSPWAGVSTSLSVSVTSATTLYAGSSARPQTVRLVSIGGNSFVNFVGPSTGTAAAPTAMLVVANVPEVVTASGPYIAAVTTTGTATLYITPGDGGL